MRYLITGCNGQLGYDIVRELLSRGEKEVLPLGGRGDMDITDKNQVYNVITNYKPDVIFHCAAYTNVDGAENNATDAYKINVFGTKNVVEAANIVNAKVIYASTDYIFDGREKDIYTEESTPNPLSIYGLTKYLGEQEVLKSNNSVIARISWVFGINNKNFVKTMLNLSEKYKELSIVDDQVGSPTYTVDLAEILVDIAKSNKTGIYNITNENFCSWAEFAEYIFDANNKKVKVNKVSTDEYYKGKEHAPRPSNSRLSKEKLNNDFYRLPPWQTAVDRYSIELKLKL